MKLNGENSIDASPEVVWKALNDPEILRRSIPGCESLEQLSDTEMKATVVTKVGPIKAKFNGEVTLSDLDPPHGYTLTGKGSGGSAGNAKGIAKVSLKPSDDGGTTLSYDVDAEVTGKLAQLGARLMTSTANRLAGQFFDTFGEIVGGGEAAPAPAAAPEPVALLGKNARIALGLFGIAVGALLLYWALAG